MSTATPVIAYKLEDILSYPQECVHLYTNVLSRCSKDLGLLYRSFCAEHQRRFQQSAAKASYYKIRSCLSLVHVECGDREAFQIKKMMKTNNGDSGAVYPSPVDRPEQETSSLSNTDPSARRGRVSA